MKYVASHTNYEHMTQSSRMSRKLRTLILIICNSFCHLIISMALCTKDPNFMNMIFCFTQDYALLFRPNCCPPLVHL